MALPSISEIGEGFEDAGEWLVGAFEDAGEWLFGDGGDADRARADAELARLRGHTPTAEDLTPEYSLLPDSVAGQAQADPRMVSAQARALKQLEDWGSGRMTPADMARRDLMRRELAQTERQQREGVMRGMQERGLGGSGLEQMSMLGAQQGMADRLSNQDAALQVAVQDRALRSIEQAGALATQGRGQSYGEAAGRGNAIDRFNMGNTAIRNQQADAGVQGTADAYQNEEDMSALALGQYNRSGDAAIANRNNQKGALGEVADWFFG